MDRGVILDLETTGLDPLKDQIIELGLLEFAIDEHWKPSLVTFYGGLEDPQQPLSESIQKITGLSDVLLKGQIIDWSLVRRVLQRSSVVIAHNADFDRSFLEKRVELEGLSLHWACSARHIDWFGHGFKTKSLNYLAADHGFVNPFAHRALFDCATTFRLIQPYLQELIERSYEQEYRLWARDASYDKRTLLKQHGYRWDPEQRVWYKLVFESQLKAEREFLRQQIYAHGSDRSECELVTFPT